MVGCIFGVHPVKQMVIKLLDRLLYLTGLPAGNSGEQREISLRASVH